jgi:hypothetical protein
MGIISAIQGPRAISTLIFAFDQNLQSFRASVRIGSVPVLAAPVARRTGSDTVSHIVLLAVRS